MIKVKVRYTLSEQGRKAALRQGLNATRDQYVVGEVDDSTLDVSGVRVTPDGEAVLDLYDMRDAPFATVQEAVEAAREIQQEKEREKEREKQRKKHEHETKVQKFMGKTVEEVIYEAYAGDWRVKDMPRDERLAALRSAAQAECKRRDAAHEAAKAAEAEAESTARAEWIRDHGSTRLQRSAAEGIECDAVYRDERLAIERPGWRWESEVPGDGDNPRNPPEEAFVLLDEARVVEPAAELLYWTVYHECDESCYGDDCPRYEYTGYVASAEFLGRRIIFGGPEDDDK